MKVRRVSAVAILALSCIFCSGSSAADAPKKITCSGKVVDEGNKPIAGAKVTLYQLMPDVEGRGLKNVTTEEQITKKDGGFSFSAAMAEEKEYKFAMLIARKEGLAIGWDNWNMRNDKAATLTMGKGYTLRGMVVDEADKPVAGAEVRIPILIIGDLRGGSVEAKYLASMEPLNLLVTSTDAKGVFEFDSIPIEARAEFTIKKAGRASISTVNPQISADYNPGQYTVQSKDIRIVQPIEARIEGKVVEKGTGKAVGGVRLFCAAQNLGGPFGVKPVVSKDDGSFSFEGLEAKTYTIRDIRSQKEPAKWVIKPAQVTTVAGQKSPGVIMEASYGGVLEVVIRDNDKKPVAGANAGVREKEGNRWQGGLSDANGVVIIRLGPGEYELQGAYKEGYSSANKQQAKTITIEEGKTERLEIELKGLPRIAGVVRDPDGRPVAGAAMRICPMGQKITNSDKEGRFEISWNPEQWGIQKIQSVLVVRDVGRNLAAVVDIDEDTKTLDVEMTPGVVFAGKVVDPKGKPIAGAKININMRVSNSGVHFDNEGVTTDHDGLYEYKSVPDGQRYTISAQAEGYGQSDVEADADYAVNNRLEIPPLMLKVADMSISGVVVDVNDKPLADVEVNVNGQGQQFRRGTTDAQGKFIIDKLCDGQVNVSANFRKGQTHMYGNVEAKAGDTDVKVVLAPPQHTGMMPNETKKQLKVLPKVTGVVRDPNGLPVAGATIRIWPMGHDVIKSNKEGKFEIEWNPEQWSSQKHQSVLVARHVRRNLAAVVDINENTKTLDVEMTQGVVFTGKVVDPKGKPIAGAKVKVSLLVSDGGISFDNEGVTTDQQGLYEYKAVPEGQRYSVSAQAEGYGRSYVGADADIAVNNRLEIPPLMLKVADMSISGVVVDVNDKPVVNAEVNVNGQGQQNRSSTTNGQGKFIIDKLCDGQVQVSANFRKGQTHMYGDVKAKAGATDVKVVVLAPPQRTGMMPNEAKKPTGMLKVYITDEQTKPVAGVRVSVLEKDGKRGNGGVSDANGVASLRLVPGEYELQRAYKEGYLFSGERQKVTIEEGKAARLEIQLKALPRIAGVVRDPNGQPVAGATIRICPRGQDVIKSDKDGKFELEWDPERWDSQQNQPVLVVRHVRRNLAAVVDIYEETKTLDIEMTPGVVFTGEVVDPNGKPIYGATINVSLRATTWISSFDNEAVTTDHDGQYEYKVVPEWQLYRVTAKADGYGQSFVSPDADQTVNNRHEVKPLVLKVADMSISGIVVDVNNKPVANTEVYADGQGQHRGSDTTNAEGKFSIDKLCDGQVEVRANFRKGQTDLDGSVSAEAGDTDIEVMITSDGNRGRPYYFNAEEFEQTKKTLITLKQCPNKEELEAAIEEAQKTVERFGGGHVIVGRVVLDGEGEVRDVQAQMEILDGGYFAGETKDLIGPVGFRMHRYAPYDLQLGGMEGSLVDVGTIYMTPLQEDQLVGLKGKVVLEGNVDPSEVVLHLNVADGPVNTPHGGTKGGRAKSIMIQASENGLIEGYGFSPIQYWCIVTAPGYLTKVFSVEFEGGQTFDLGTVKLEIPRQIRLSYIVAAEPPFDLKALESVKIPAGTRWQAGDCKGYGWDLEFGQDKGFIIMKYSYAPCIMRDLGEGEIADYVNVDKTKIGHKSPENQKANNGHVYLLHQICWKRWVLFKIVIE